MKDQDVSFERRPGRGWQAFYAGFALLLGTTATAVHAQDFPTKPVKIVVPYAAGGGADVLARLAAERLAPRLGKAVVVENKSGAAGTLGADVVARSPADGHTLLLTPSGPMAIAEHLSPPPPYNAARDFAPLVLVARQPMLFVVREDAPEKDMKSFIAAAKANPGKLNFSSAGAGTENHLTGELLKKETGIDITHIPYRGGGPALQAMLAGDVNMVVIVTGAIRPFLQDGRAHALATTASKRLADFPSIPTTAELGMPTVNAVASYGLVAPAKTPPEVLSKLEAAILQVCEDADFRKRLTNMSVEVAGIPSKEYRALLESERRTWGEVIRFAQR